LLNTVKLTQIEPGHGLRANESLWSSDAQVRFVLQADGNAVVYRECDNKALWSTGYMASGNTLQMQRDGNLVVYNKEGEALWSSRTNSERFAGAVLRLENEGSLCLLKNDQCLWKSGGYSLCQPAQSPLFKNAKGIHILAGFATLIL
jgi:hypothetical protein